MKKMQGPFQFKNTWLLRFVYKKIAISKLQGCLLNCDFSSVTRTIDVEEKDKTT